MKRLFLAPRPATVLILASLVYCLPLFLQWDGWGRGDWDQSTFRYLTPRLAMLRDGQLPLWNPYVNGGNVLLAHPNCPAFSPWYLPTLLLGASLGVRLHVLLFMILGTTGMAALLGRWGVSPPGRILGGIVLMMSAHLALHSTEGHLEWCMLGLAPWIILCLERSRDHWPAVVWGALLLASVLMHGAVYILAVFVPFLTLWVVLEKFRDGSWALAVRWGAMAILSLLLSAVVAFPRLEFILGHPRTIQRVQQVAAAAVPSMTLSPSQAAQFRSTRDFLNPPDDELDRVLALPPVYSAESENGRWRKLNIELRTTSDWTDVQFSGVSYVLAIDPPEGDEKTEEYLDRARLSTEGIAIQNPVPAMPAAAAPAAEVEAASLEPLLAATRRAALYVRRPRWGGLHLRILRGDRGATDLVIRCGDRLRLKVHHDARTGKPSNPLDATVSRDSLLRGGILYGKWCQLEVTLQTTSDWATAELVDLPYLFRVEDPVRESGNPLPCRLRPLLARDPAPGEQAVSVRAILCFPYPRADDVVLLVRQGVEGRTRLYFRTSRGTTFPAVRTSRHGSEEQTRLEYVLPREIIEERLDPLTVPRQWQLDQLGMWYGWHEYGCYMTWAGMAAALAGIVVVLRRRWPLAAAGGAMALAAAGSALPLNLWATVQRLPLYGSLQCSARLLAAAVFVLAACAGFGLDWMGQWVGRLRGPRWRGLFEYGLVLAVYLELAVLAGSLFSDIFVCPPRAVAEHESFAQRYAEEGVRYAAMYSAHCPYVESNSGVLRHYENLAVPRGNIRLEGDPAYRGETYLDGGYGTAKLTAWSMARVTVALAVEASDRLVLNQNYDPGWKALCRSKDGTVYRLRAQRSSDGLVSLPVEPGNIEVQFYYLPDSLISGAIVSALALLGSAGLLVATAPSPKLRRRLW